jgi:hypothetical protein
VSMLTRDNNAPAQRSVGDRVISGWSWELTGLVLLLTLHPIIAPDFWWQVSRGRAVWAGQLTPSQSLLAFETNSDADWLGGLPWYLLFMNAGPAIICFGLAIAAVIIANSIAKSFAAQMHFSRIRIALIFLGFAAARNSWASTPALIDACGVVATWFLAGDLRRHVSQPRISMGFLLLCFSELIWANFATIPLVGLLVTFARLNLDDRNCRSQVSTRYQLALFACMILAGSATPRGSLTFFDSLKVLFPWTSADLGTLAAAGILPRFDWLPSAESSAFLLLCIVDLILLVRKAARENVTSWQGLGFLTLAVLMTASSSANLGISGLFLMFCTMELFQSQPSDEMTSDTVLTARRSAWISRLLSLFLAAFAIGVGSGLWPGSETRLGWGLAPQIEPALIENIMAEFKLDGSCYCSGARETGLLAWLRPGSIRPADFPLRALLSGRLQEHVRIGWDLGHKRRDQYRRSDGSYGGWLKPLRERRTRLLFISSDDHGIIRALDSSLWKPLAIDTPSLPYGLVGDPSISRRLNDVLSTFDVIESGEWTYPIPPASGTGDHFDLWGWFTGLRDRQLDLRLVRTLVAMKRYIAALKVLKYGLQQKDNDARREFRAIQMALAYREFLANGQATCWRMCAYLESGGDPFLLKRVNPAGESAFVSLPEGFKIAASDYAQHNFESAKKRLSVSHPASLFALSQISLEEGNPQQAERWSKDLIQRFSDSTESKAIVNVVLSNSK